MESVWGVLVQVACCCHRDGCLSNEEFQNVILKAIRKYTLESSQAYVQEAAGEGGRKDRRK